MKLRFQQAICNTSKSKMQQLGRAGHVPTNVMVHCGQGWLRGPPRAFRRQRVAVRINQRAQPVCVFQPVPRGPFRGVYGEWEITDEDIREVWTYRAGLTATAAAFVAVLAAHLLPEGQAELLRGAENGICIAGAAGLGVSLALIHIYVTPLKRMLQVFWGLGVAGGAFLMATHLDTPLPAFVMDHPWAVWLVGPLFAALTGVSFKEGFCYGKFEAFALTLVLPALLLGHLFSVVPAEGEQALAVTAAALLSLFAARKYTQAVKDDIGDGSVFTLMKLPEEQQQAVLAARRGVLGGDDDDF